MGEIGSGSGSSYSTSLDTDSTVEVNAPSANKTKARAEVINDLSACIVAVETTLGTSPQGSKADVKTFLQTQHNADGTHGAITAPSIALSGAITGATTINTFPISATPAANAVPVSDATKGILYGLSDGTNSIHIKIINISDWNMNSATAVLIPHGLTLAKIRAVSVIIRNDIDTVHYPLTPGHISTPAEIDGYFEVDASNVNCRCKLGGFFQSVDYDSTGYNRGWITITYVE